MYDLDEWHQPTSSATDQVTGNEQHRFFLVYKTRVYFGICMFAAYMSRDRSSSSCDKSRFCWEYRGSCCANSLYIASLLWWDLKTDDVV